MESAESGRSAFRVLFVCTGNTCRSPMAEAVARQELGVRGWTHVDVGSAGVATMDGLPASGGAVRAAGERGIDLSRHRSTRLTGRVVEAADLILTMSPGHLARVEELGGAGKGHLLTAFAREGSVGAGGRPGGTGQAGGAGEADGGGDGGGKEGPGDAGVPDPFGGSDDLYRETLAVLDELVQAVLRRLEPER